MNAEDLAYFELYGEYPVYSRRGLLQYRFTEYSYTMARLASFHRKRPYRAL
ncbi:hypothetical protein [Hymenobacter guriensis]|uniref:Uncharacterized protein n=1 Tax=Hymenobacter guriensis TaxID=2793065 RepID=A0ABS0KYD9_9BACT|nr:hypothetical protein [Hymenobacter guriensis]MBG8552373.1 hypothetical protein [Hymenobacter guriensis]